MTILLSSVEAIFCAEDIEGYIKIHGAPDNEYDSEAKEIAEALNTLDSRQLTEENIISIISPIWARWFNLDEDDIGKRMPGFKNVARALLLEKDRK